MKTAPSNARQPGENLKACKARLKQTGQQIKAYLKGRLVHISTQIVRLPVLGADATVDEAVLRGQYRDVRLVTLPDGKQMRVGRTKGVAYRKPIGLSFAGGKDPKYRPGFKRRQVAQAILAGEKPDFEMIDYRARFGYPVFS